MAIPNGGLITETNRQYYAGAEQFTITSTAVGQTFTSTFDTNLVFGDSDPTTNGYNLNNGDTRTYPKSFGLVLAKGTVVQNIIWSSG